MNFKKIWLAIVGFAIFMATTIGAFADPQTIRLCTGGKDGIYHQAGGMIQRMAIGDPNVSVQVVYDTGGTWGNIQRTLNGECDAFIGQPDGHALLKRQNEAQARTIKPIAELHTEYLHALCSKKSGVGDVGDLENDPKKYSIALGNQGSGAWLIWQNLIAQDKDYGSVPVTNEEGDIALASVASNETTCMLVPAALGTPVVRHADEYYGDGVNLVGVNDRDFDNAQAPDGTYLYKYEKIPSGTYTKSLQGWFSGKSTLTWRAKVYINIDRFSNTSAANSFIAAVHKAKPGIIAAFDKK